MPTGTTQETGKMDLNEATLEKLFYKGLDTQGEYNSRKTALQLMENLGTIAKITNISLDTCMGLFASGKPLEAINSQLLDQSTLKLPFKIHEWSGLNEKFPICANCNVNKSEVYLDCDYSSCAKCLEDLIYTLVSIF